MLWTMILLVVSNRGTTWTGSEIGRLGSDLLVFRSDVRRGNLPEVYTAHRRFRYRQVVEGPQVVAFIIATTRLVTFVMSIRVKESFST
jgi:hypothetical protein